ASSAPPLSWWGIPGRAPPAGRAPASRAVAHGNQEERMKTSTSTIEVSAPSRDTYLDLTEDLQRAIKDSGVTEGMVVAFCAHTTCALLINEWEDGAQEDFRNLLHGLVPEDRYYAHDDLDRRTQNLAESHERRNGHAHAKATPLSARSPHVVSGRVPAKAFLRPASSPASPVVGGEPAFGRGQRLILFEMDEPK